MQAECGQLLAMAENFNLAVAAWERALGRVALSSTAKISRAGRVVAVTLGRARCMAFDHRADPLRDGGVVDVHIEPGYAPGVAAAVMASKSDRGG